ncbi:MAG TPA: hypothetical protein VN031_02780 [Candidatus Microsaccharimonas sp.]|nr:hypothetical protein [Candidatus Microsaccharimonas sp.]
MTTDITHNPESFDPAEPTERLFHSIEGVERDMFEGARQFLWIEQGIDLYHARPDQAHSLTNGLHTYVSTISNNKIDDLNGTPRVSQANDADPDSAMRDWSERETRRLLTQGRKAVTTRGETIFSIPRDSITRRIRDYYARYGASQYGKDPVTRQLAENQLQTGIHFITKGAEPLLPGQTIPRRKAEYIVRGYPEVSIALRLGELFRELQLTTAANSAEVLAWAYGNRFQELSTKLGETTRPIQIQPVSVPSGEMPDKPMRPRRPKE